MMDPVSIERMSGSRDKMSVGAVSGRCMAGRSSKLIARDGASARRGLGWRQLPLLPVEPPRRTSPGRPLRSYYLWVRLRSSLSYSRSRDIGQEFGSWLRRALCVADFGALSVEWVKASAKRDLRIGDDQLFVVMAHHCGLGGEFISDGRAIRFRDVYDG